MKESRRILAALYCVLASDVVQAQYDIDTRLPTCDTLAWSQAVRDSYPDMQQICRGIYQRDGVRYAQAEVEVLRVSGNRMTVRTIHVDGSPGHETTVRVGPQWRAQIDGKSLRAGELIAGQRLIVYIPQHRFELTSEAGDGPAKESTPASGDSGAAQ